VKIIKREKIRDLDLHLIGDVYREENKIIFLYEEGYGLHKMKEIE